jgi:hypothetical protein
VLIDIFGAQKYREYRDEVIQIETICSEKPMKTDEETVRQVSPETGQQTAQHRDNMMTMNDKSHI